MTERSFDSKGHLDLLILSVLADGKAHGYRIIAQLRERSDGAFDLPEGTVYPALRRLESMGLLTGHWETAQGRPRRVYQINPAGRTILAERTDAWRRFASSINAVIGLPP